MSDNETETQEVPPVEQSFANLLKKFGVGKKDNMAETITENISRVGGETVLEDPRRLAERLASWHEYITPVKRKLILEQWFAERGIEVPEEAIKVAGIKGSEIREKEEEKEKAKEAEEKRKAKFYVDPENGAIRPAKGDEERLTWGEAEQVADRIKKEQAKGNKESKESPFVIGEEGNWKLNPKAAIGGLELLAFEAVKKSRERGESLDPFEVMKDRAKDIEMMRSVFGGGKEGGSFGELADALLKVKELTGTDEETKQLLAGIYKSLREGGEGKGESEDVKALREEVKGLRDDLTKKDRERLDDQISSLSTALSEVRTGLARAQSEARATDEYGIMSEAIKMVDHRLGAIEGTVRGVLGKPPGLLPLAVKKEITEAISEEAVEEGALDQLAKEVLYQH